MLTRGMDLPRVLRMVQTANKARQIAKRYPATSSLAAAGIAGVLGYMLVRRLSSSGFSAVGEGDDAAQPREGNWFETLVDMVARRGGDGGEDENEDDDDERHDDAEDASD
jgi:hypothetical protein